MVTDQVFTEVLEQAQFGKPDSSTGLDCVIVSAAFDQGCDRLPVRRVSEVNVDGPNA